MRYQGISICESLSESGQHVQVVLRVFSSEVVTLFSLGAVGQEAD